MPGPNPILNLPFILAGMGEGSRGYIQGMQAEDEHERNQAMLQQLVKRSAFEQQMQGPELAEMQNRARLSQVQATSAEEEEKPLSPGEEAAYNNALAVTGKPPLPSGMKRKDARAYLSTMGSLTRQVSPLTLQDRRDAALASRLATQEKGKNQRQENVLHSNSTRAMQTAYDALNQQLSGLSGKGIGPDDPLYQSTKNARDQIHGSMNDPAFTGVQSPIGSDALDESGQLPDPFGGDQQ